MVAKKTEKNACIQAQLDQKEILHKKEQLIFNERIARLNKFMEECKKSGSLQSEACQRMIAEQQSQMYQIMAEKNKA